MAALPGIVGGATILAAFVPGLTWSSEAVSLRIALFNAGAIATVWTVSRRAAASSGVVRAVGGAAILANAWYLVMVGLSIGRPQPPDADPEFRLAWFFAGMAMWLADAAFGAAALPGRIVARPVALALLLGSILAILGIDRLELVRGDLGWLFTPIALAGAALNGAAWVLIGLQLLRGDDPARELAA